MPGSFKVQHEQFYSPRKPPFIDTQLTVHCSTTSNRQGREPHNFHSQLKLKQDVVYIYTVDYHSVIKGITEIMVFSTLLYKVGP